MSYTLKYTGSEIDDILDRAVAGGEIDTELAGKQDTLTFDDAPESGSDNPVKSGGIYDAIQAGGATALAAFATDSVTPGDVVSFPDGADNIPVKSFTGSILPVQNLNGYDNPWPAGGGANKWDEQWEVGSINQETGANATASNVIRAKNICPCLSSAEYYLGTNVSAIYWYASDDSYIGFDYNNTTGNVRTSPATAAGFRILLKSSYGTTYHNDVAINYPSTVTTYSPYANICPISGWSGAEITRAGGNLLESLENGSRLSDGTKTVSAIRLRSANYMPVSAGDTVMVQATTSASKTLQISCQAWTTNTDGSNTRLYDSGWQSIPFVYTIPSGGKYCTFVLRYSNESNIDKSEITSSSVFAGPNIILDICINQWDEQWELGGIVWNTGEEVAGTDRIRTGFIPVAPNSSFYVHVDQTLTAFTQGGVVYYDASKNWVGMTNAQPFNKAYTAPATAHYMRFVFQGLTSYSTGISINSPASITGYYPYTGRNPVYAGTITSLGGGQWKIQPTHGITDLANITPTTITSNDKTIYDYSVSGLVKDNTADGWMEQYQQYKGTSAWTMPNYSFLIRADRAGHVLVNNDYTVTDTPAGKFVYPLATLPDPITVDASDLATLLGSNTVWTDCGSVTEMTYRADTALYVQKLIGGGSLSLSMAAPSPSLSLGRVGVLAEPEVSEPEQADEEAEQLEQTEEAEEE